MNGYNDDYNLGADFAELQRLAADLAAANAFDLQDMIVATEKSHELIKQLNFISVFDKNEEVREFLKQILLIISQLHQVAQQQEVGAPRPNRMMSALTAAFDKFFNSIVSKKNQERLSTAASFLPYVSGIINAFETLPYYWHYADRREKVALVLGVTLMTTAISLLIASALNPVVPAVVVGFPLVVMGCLTLGRALYAIIIENPKQKHQEMQQIQKVSKELVKMEESVSAKVQELDAEAKLGKSLGAEPKKRQTSKAITIGPAKNKNSNKKKLRLPKSAKKAKVHRGSPDYSPMRSW